MRYYPAPEKGLTYERVNRVIESVFAEHGKGQVSMPPKVYITLPYGDFRTMPAYVPSLEMCGVKVVNVHPDNRERGLPTVMALITLLDVTTGLPLAIIHATGLTDMRTGAAGAVAAAHLARSREISLGIIGSGRQAEAQIAAIAAELSVHEVLIWSRTEGNAEKLAERWRSIDARAASIQRASACDVVVTATPALRPVVMSEWIHEGTHINAIGADGPGKEELDPAILARSSIYVDDINQAIHSGEINVPIRQGLFQPHQISGTLGEVVLGKKKRRSSDEITLFDSTGLAIQDLAIAHLAIQESEYLELPLPVGGGSTHSFL